MGQKVLEAETARVRTKPTESLDAYDCVLRALALFYKFDDDDFFACGRFLDRAIELDPAYAQAYAYKAWWFNLLIGESGKTLLEIILSPRSRRAGRANSTRTTRSCSRLRHTSERSSPDNRKRPPRYSSDRCTRTQNSSFAWGMSAATCSYLGRPEDALRSFAQRVAAVAVRSPQFRLLHECRHRRVRGRAIRGSDRLAAARRTRESRVLRLPPRTLAAVYGMAGHEEEAQKMRSEMLAVDPAFRIGEFVARYPLRRADDLNRYITGLRRAGLPGIVRHADVNIHLAFRRR